MVKSGQPWSGLVPCRDATGALATPSVGPAGVLYVNGVANGASVTISGSNPYKWTVTLPALNAGDIVSMYITATIATIATANTVAEDVADTIRISDVEVEVVNAILAAVIEGTLTFQQVQRIMLAALAGKSTGGGTATVTFRDVADALDRISASVDANGNRNSITLNGG